MRRYLFRSRAEAEDAYSRASGELTPALVALADVLRGAVTWLDRDPFRAGLVRPDGPHGGYVVIVQHVRPPQFPVVRVHRIDDLRDALDHGRRHYATDGAEARTFTDLLAAVFAERDRQAG